jgi:DNA-binding NtrC family response regulator
VAGWIERNLGLDYGWPGNMRELEQCVRSLVVHGAYQPLAAVAGRGSSDDLSRRLGESRLRADELVTLYCAVVHQRTGSFSETGRLLGLDRRTVAARVAAAQRGGRPRAGPG